MVAFAPNDIAEEEAVTASPDLLDTLATGDAFDARFFVAAIVSSDGVIRPLFISG